jgi:hypothetical protein
MTRVLQARSWAYGDPSIEERHFEDARQKIDSNATIQSEVTVLGANLDSCTANGNHGQQCV